MTGKRRTKAELADLAVEVINLRRIGLSYEEIGKKLDTPPATCHRVFKKAVERIPQQSIRDLRLLQYERLEGLYRIAMSHSEDEGAGPQFIKQALDALKQMAELNGLNAPQVIKSEITGKDGGPIETATPVKILGVSQEDFKAMTQEERDVVRAICVRQIERQKVSNVH